MTRSATPSNPNVALLSTIRMWMTMAPDSIEGPDSPVSDVRPNPRAKFSSAAELERKALLKQIEETLGMCSPVAPAASTNS